MANFFSNIIDRLKKGINAPEVQSSPGARFIKSAVSNIKSAVKPLAVSMGEAYAHNFDPETKRNYRLADENIAKAQTQLSQKIATVNDVEKKKKLLRLKMDIAQKTPSILDRKVSYTPKEIASSGAQTAALAIGAPKLATKAGMATLGINSAFSGITEKLFGGSFAEGAGKGAAFTPAILATLGLTNPVISKLLPKASGFAPRIGAGVANVVQGKLIDISGGKPTTPQSLVLDLATGLLGGKAQFDAPRVKGFTVGKDTMDEIIKAEDMLKNPTKYIGNITGTPKARLLYTKQARDEVIQEARKTLDILAGKYLPTKEFEKTIDRPQAIIKALVDLNKENKLGNFKVGLVAEADTPLQKMDVPETKIPKDIPTDEARQIKLDRLRNLVTYNDTLRRMGYSKKQADLIGFEKAGDIIRNNISPNRFDPVAPEVARDLRDTQKAVEGPKPQTPVEKKINWVDYLRTPDRVLEKIGLKKEAQVLKMQYENYLKELPEEIGNVTKWSEQVRPEAKENLFRYLDGRTGDMTAPLSIQELNVAREIQGYLKTWATKLGLPADKQVSHYITHIFEKDFITKEFDEDLAKLITNKITGSVYDPFLQKRLGAQGYVEDPWRALDAYIKRAVRKYNMDPALAKLEKASQNLELSQTNYVKQLTDRINLRPTELDNLIDNSVKSIPNIGYKLGQRPMAAASRTVRQSVYRATLGMNVSTALKNLTQGVNTYAKLGEKYTTLGYIKAMKDLFFRSGELDDIGVLRQSFVQDRNLSGVKRIMDTVDAGLFGLMGIAERINRGAAYYGAKAKALSAGASEAEASMVGKELARQTQFTFGSVDTPLILQSDIAKTLLQFQSFNLKQAEFLGEMIKNKEWGGMIRWLGANAALIYFIGDAVGLEYKNLIPGYDFLSGKSKLGETPAVQLAGNVVKSALGDEDTRKQAREDIINNLFATVIPGGVQLKKTIGGIVSTKEKGVFNQKGSLKYPVANDLFYNAVFGPTRGEAANLYFDEQLTPLSANDTVVWKALVEKGQDPYKAWSLLYQKRIAEGIPAKVSAITKDPTTGIEVKKRDAQAVMDEAKSLIKKLQQFGSLNDVVDKVVEPEARSSETPPTSNQPKIDPIVTPQVNPTSKKLAFSGKVKKVAKPKLRATRRLKIKKTALSKKSPKRILLANSGRFLPKNRRRLKIIA